MTFTFFCFHVSKILNSLQEWIEKRLFGQFFEVLTPSDGESRFLDIECLVFQSHACLACVRINVKCDNF